MSFLRPPGARPGRRARPLLLALAAGVVGCGAPSGRTDSATAVPQGTSAPAQSATQDASSWRPPNDADIPRDSLGASIRRGLALVLHTPDSLPRYAPGRIGCSNCHLSGGRAPDAAPLVASHARYPRYLSRAGAVVSLTDRVNYCFTRSLAGTRLPAESREMQDILAYLAWLSRGAPVWTSKTAGGEGLPAMPALVGDSARGRQVYVAKCQSCHLPDGQGAGAVPALWGARSFAVGASMARQSKAASFIWHNMPLGQPRSLTQQQAFDVAAFVVAKPRPDHPEKANDWPGGDAPADVPYRTRAHAPFRAPPLLPRANPAGSRVPSPTSVRTRTNR